MKPGQLSSSLRTSLETVRIKLLLMRHFGLVMRDTKSFYSLSREGEKLNSGIKELVELGLSYETIYAVLSCKWMQEILNELTRGNRK